MFKAWVKNVYSLCVDGVVTSAHSYTPLASHYQLTTNTSVQPALYTTFINSFTPPSYTAFLTNLPLINTYLYTLSTAPIIKKNKKK